MSEWQRWKGIMKAYESSFWNKVKKEKEDECWEWLASKNKDGYGQLWIGHTFIPPHRFSWMLHRQCSIPEGMLILHGCDNPACCNPSHLYLGTVSDNTMDRKNRTHISKEKYANNMKLYFGEIWLIRRLKIVKSRGTYTRYVFPENRVAKMFKVDQSLIHLIWKSDRWLSKEGTYV